MNTTNKLAEALTLGLECAYELLAEKRQALAGHPEKVAPYQEMADYLRTFPERFTIPQPALAQRREPLTDGQLSALLKEARKIIRASSSRSLAKDWDRRATQALAGATTGEQRR